IIAGLTSGLNTLQAYDYNINQQLNHNYNWVLTNGNIINGQGTNAIKVQWLTAGVGKIKTTITNVNGCSKSDSITVNINTTPTIISFTPQTGTNGTVVTINGGNFTDASAVTFGGVNAKSFNVVSNTVVSAIVDTGATGSVSVVTPSGTALLNTFTYINNTGVAEYVTQSYSIFPNPVSSEIIIESDKTLNNASFELMDVNGKVLITTTCNNATNRFNIDVKTLSPAVYFLRITSQGQTSTVKVVKQ
ncbi:MAG: T9SS type A sorting domain-containing protein, partial [Bacteroidia bacterium]|nr:T9SS type A sorting domain-containing protein [Bacteroidia bacterium]